MCGVVGYIGDKNCTELIFNGLKKLEYRGYDSAGIAVYDGKSIHLVKAEGKLQNLEGKLAQLPKSAHVGIGHTRWATHGPPTMANAHPHMTEDVTIIHNGIIENYADLKKDLLARGVKFSSDTDTEVVLHLLAAEIQAASSVKDAIVKTLGQIHGAFTIGLFSKKDPDALYLMKQGSPCVIGVGEGENFFASDALALLPHTKKLIFLNDGEMARLTKTKIELWDFLGDALHRKPVTVDWTAASADKQGYKHYMLKEIYEQPAVIANTLGRLIDTKNQRIITEKLLPKNFAQLDIDYIVYVACGTAYYSTVLAKYFLEALANIPVSAELASEFRYRKPCITKRTLVIAVTQSGETIDTLACIKYAKSLGCPTFSICNAPYSSIPREVDHTVYMECGPEVGVASTKAYTAMVLNHFLFTLAVAKQLQRLSSQDEKKHISDLMKLPIVIDKCLSYLEKIEEVAQKFSESEHFLFIGRGVQYVTAMEGALKLKEISYIHAEAYAGGELKHGPIALVDKNMPIVAIIPKDSTYEKMISNVEEVRAREGVIIVLGDPADEKIKSLAAAFIPCPEIKNDYLQAIVSVIPLQLLAYDIAVKRGTDVDQPRNLAKSVTVE